MQRIRVALVQPNVERLARAATLQAVLAMIDRAAEHDPPPDLIVLPAFAGVAEFFRGETDFIERFPGQTAAAIGQRARSWGVFIAYGQVERVGAGYSIASVLLDPDGDARIVHRQMAGLPANPSITKGDRYSIAQTLLGGVGLMTCGDVLDEAVWRQASSAAAQFVVACTSNCIGQPESMDSPLWIEEAQRHVRHFGIPLLAACNAAGRAGQGGCTVHIGVNGVQHQSAFDRSEVTHIEVRGRTVAGDARPTGS